MTGSGSDGGLAPDLQSQWWSGAVLGRQLRTPRSAAILQLVSCLLSLAFCWHLFSVEFVTGTARFWTNPRGLDITTSISGYYAFIKSPWEFPIFQVSQLGYPVGVNIIYTDGIPIVAFIGRIVYAVTGIAVNLYGAWLVTCFIASAASLTALVGLLGGRTIPTACAAAVLGCAMPALLYRWGNPALMAHFEIILALAFCVATRKGRSPAWYLATSVPLCLLALWTNAYIFAMVTALVAVAMGQTAINRQLPLKAGLFIFAVLASAIVATMAVSGHLSNPGSNGAPGYGYYSLNWLSPILPQFSGILPFGMFVGILDATGGQYEGFSYLGAGDLLLTIVSARDLGRWFNRAPQPLLRFVLLGFILFAVTPNTCLGYWCSGRTLDLGITEIFRSSGRFVWPALYAVSAAAVALTATRRRHAPLLLLAAALLQWLDTVPLQNAFAKSVSEPAPWVLDAAAWQRALAVSETVRVFPSFSCLVNSSTVLVDAEIAVEIQLLASVAGVRVNSVYAARHRVDCAAEEASGRGLVPIANITVYLDTFPGYTEIRSASAATPNCQSTASMVVCVPAAAGRSPGRLTEIAFESAAH